MKSQCPRSNNQTNPIFQITKSFSFCYGHRLYKDPGKCGHIHGHTGSVDITLESEKLDDLGMLKNFDTLKSIMGKWIDENIDHRMLLNKEDPLVNILNDAGEKIFVLDSNPTAENMARTIFNVASMNGLPVKSATFWESPTASANYSK